MSFVENTLERTHIAALEMPRAAVIVAEEINQPQCIVIGDKSGETLARLRMTGAKYLSLKSARARACTAASIGAPSQAIPPQVAPSLDRRRDRGAKSPAWRVVCQSISIVCSSAASASALAAQSKTPPSGPPRLPPFPPVRCNVPRLSDVIASSFTASKIFRKREDCFFPLPV